MVMAPSSLAPLEPEAGTKKKGKLYVSNQLYGTESKTSDVYDTTVTGLVRGAMEGVNGTLLAYGATGSGKTHTLTGNSHEPGVVRLAIDQVFALMAATDEGKQYTVHIGYHEVYNENIIDLLPLAAGSSHVIEKRSTPVSRKDVLLELIQKAESNRTTRSTNYNEHSSRSHAILSLTIESCLKGTSDVRTGRLTFVDLAGSEGAIETTGDRKQDAEGSNINKSLLALRQVVGQLVKKAKVPSFRDSKLTFPLKPSLSGHSNLVVVCNVSLEDDQAQIDRTANTLDFAKELQRVILPTTVADAEPEPKKLADYQREAKEQQQEIERLSTALRTEVCEERARADAAEAELREARKKLAEVSSFIIPGGVQPSAAPEPDQSGPPSAAPSQSPTALTASTGTDLLSPEGKDDALTSVSLPLTIMEAVPSSSAKPRPPPPVEASLDSSSTLMEPASEQKPSIAPLHPVVARRPKPAPPKVDYSAYLSLMTDLEPCHASTSTGTSTASTSNTKRKPPPTTSLTAPPSKRPTPLSAPTSSYPAQPPVTWRRLIAFNLHTSLPFSTCFPHDSSLLSVSSPSGHISSSLAIAVLPVLGRVQDPETGAGFRIVTEKRMLPRDAAGGKLPSKKGVWWMCNVCATAVERPKRAWVLEGVEAMGRHYESVHQCSRSVGRR